MWGKASLLLLSLLVLPGLVRSWRPQRLDLESGYFAWTYPTKGSNETFNVLDTVQFSWVPTVKERYVYINDTNAGALPSTKHEGKSGIWRYSKFQEQYEPHISSWPVKLHLAAGASPGPTFYLTSTMGSPKTYLLGLTLVASPSLRPLSATTSTTVSPVKTTAASSNGKGHHTGPGKGRFSRVIKDMRKAILRFISKTTDVPPKGHSSHAGSTERTRESPQQRTPVRSAPTKTSPEKGSHMSTTERSRASPQHGSQRRPSPAKTPTERVSPLSSITETKTSSERTLRVRPTARTQTSPEGARDAKSTGGNAVIQTTRPRKSKGPSRSRVSGVPTAFSGGSAQDNHMSALSTGASIGIGVSIGIVVLVLGLVVRTLYKRRRGRRKMAESDLSKERRACSSEMSASASGSSSGSVRNTAEDADEAGELDSGAVRPVSELPSNEPAQELPYNSFIREAPDSTIHEAPDTSVWRRESRLSDADDKEDRGSTVSSCPVSPISTFSETLNFTITSTFSPISPLTEDRLPPYSA